jgi:death-on-curing family protein
MDGNKRTAVLALSEFLKRNSYLLSASNDELYQFAIDVAISKLDKDQIAEWIRVHIREQ